MPALGNALGLPFQRRGAATAVVHAWYWEDSIVMEWESGIVILAE
jgi:hypothetical protein